MSERNTAYIPPTDTGYLHLVPSSDNADLPEDIEHNRGLSRKDTFYPSAQIGNRGMFYLGDRFGYVGEGGRLCHVPAKYKNHEIFLLGDKRLAVVSPETQQVVAVLFAPNDLWAKNPEKSYYSFDANDIMPVTAEAIAKDGSLRTDLENFQYVSPEDRRDQSGMMRQEARKKQLLDTFIKLGVIQTINGLTIWDKDKLSQLVFANDGNVYLGDNKVPVTGKVIKGPSSIFDHLKDEVGLFADEYKQASDSGIVAVKKLKPHRIFYLPANGEAALSIPAIRQNWKQVAPWEIGAAGRTNLDMELETGEKISMREAAIAKRIYGDLQGFRNKDGRLMVVDESGETVPMMASLLPQLKAENTLLHNNPVEFVSNYCPNLVSRGLLLPADFRNVSGWRKDINIFPRNILSDGNLNLDGFLFPLYELSDKEKETLSGMKLSAGNYGLIEKRPNGQMEIVYTIQVPTNIMRDKEEKRANRKENYYVKKADLVLRQYKITDDNLRLEDESPEQYASRIQTIADVKFVLDTMQDLVIQTKQPLRDLLSWREQQWLVTVIKHKPAIKDRVLSATKELGVEFLKSFLICEQGLGNADKVLQLADSLDKKDAANLFKDYAGIMKYAEEFSAIVSTKLELRYPNRFNRQSFYLSLLHRAKDFIVASAEVVSQNSEAKYQDVLKVVSAQNQGLDINNCRQAVISAAMIEMVNLVGDVEARAVLDKVYSDDVSPDMQTAVNEAYQYITPAPTDAVAIHELEDFYNNNIRFEEYEINKQMNQTELEYLTNSLHPEARTLDLGCGTGRLLIPLKQAGYNVVGLDFSSRHIQQVREKAPDIPVIQGDWKKTGLQNKDFATVYSLGRSILHENQLSGQMELFSEVNRLLPLGGRFLFDIPDRTQGSYRRLVEQYKDTMQKRGVERFRFGTIYDSPDGKHFASRYVYSHEDIVALAEASGFEIEEIRREDLATGQEDINIYYSLRKTEDLNSAK